MNGTHAPCKDIQGNHQYSVAVQRPYRRMLLDILAQKRGEIQSALAEVPRMPFYSQEGALAERAEILNLQTLSEAEVLDALERMRAGCYGICMDCGKRIPKKRLNALPATGFCVGCKNETEKAHAPRTNSEPADWDRVRDERADEDTELDLYV